MKKTGLYLLILALCAGSACKFPGRVRSGEEMLLLALLSLTQNTTCEYQGTSRLSFHTFLGSTGADTGAAACATRSGGAAMTGHVGVGVASMNGKSPLLSYNANQDILVTSLDSSGAVEWFTHLGSATNDQASSITELSDGLAIAGIAGANIPTLQGKTPRNGFTTADDMFVAKLTSSGSVDWYTFLGSTGNELANRMIPTSDGGLLVAGFSSAAVASLQGKSPVLSFAGGAGDMTIIKLTSSGDVEWYTHLGGAAGSDFAMTAAQTTDGGYIVAGVAGANIATMNGKTPINAFNAANEGFVVRLSSTGAVEWYTFLGSANADQLNGVTAANDGGYVVVGAATGNIASLQGKSPLIAYNASSDMLIIKLTSAGSVEWYTFAGGATVDEAWTVRESSDGSLTIGGLANTNIATLGGRTPLNAYTASADAMVLKLTSSGSVTWYTFIGGASTEDAKNLRLTSDGGILFSGTGASFSLSGLTALNPYSAGTDHILVKLKSDGTF